MTGESIQTSGIPVEKRRTRGGWVPVGTAADRRANHIERGTQRGKQTRARILAAARRVFERDGYFEATINDIVSEAGVARGSFYTYFTSKLEVFQLIAAEVDRCIDESVTTQPGDVRKDVISNLERSHRRYFAAYREHASIYGLTEQVATIDAGVQEARLRSRQRHVARVARCIQRWQERGVADPDIDPHTSAGALVSMISNFNYWRLVGHDEYDEEQAAETLTEIWVRALKLRRRPSRPRAGAGLAATATPAAAPQPSDDKSTSRMNATMA